MILTIRTARAALLAGVSLGLLAPAAAAQTGTAVAQRAAAEADMAARGQVTGVVTDANGNLLAGATVELEGSNVVETTGTDGRFVLRGVPAGEARVLVRYFGTAPVQQAVAVSAGTTVTLNVTVGAPVGEEGGAIVVTASRPIAESEAAAIQLQRSSPALVSVLAADSIGRFPDQNLGAALARLSGVGVERDQGQERFISIRGARNSWTTVSFDGINVVSPAGRTTRFDTMPAAIASKVIVRKAVTADLTGETVAGNVDVQTRSAFDYPGLRFAADLGAGFSELGGGRQYNVNSYLSNRFANDTIGILVSASRFEVDMITDNFESRFERAPEDLEPGFDERIWTNFFDNRIYRLTRSNTAFTGRIDWRPGDAHQIFLSSVWTQFRDEEQRQVYGFDFDDGAVRTTATTPALGARSGYADVRTGNTPLQGTLFGVEIESQFGTSNSPQTIFTNTLGGNHFLGDWQVSWRGNFTRGDDAQNPPFGSQWNSPSNPALRPSIVYDFTDPRDPKLQFFETVVAADGTRSLGRSRNFISPTELPLVNITRTDRLDRTDAYTARLDIDRTFDLFGQDTKIQFGFQYNYRDKTSERTVLEARPTELNAAGIPLPLQADAIDRSPIKTGLPQNYGFFYFDTPALEALMTSYIDAGAVRIQPNTSENNDYRVTEDVLAGYLMGTMFFGRGNIVAGVRAERYENTGTALATIGGVREELTVSSSKTLLFPSLHINFDATDEIKLRFSVNSGAARADYAVLRPNLAVDDVNGVISGGNPFAEPEKAIGIDAYLEWYMNNRGFFSIGAYYKDLRDVLFNATTIFGSDVLNESGIDRSGYDFTTTLNGGDGEIKGIEIAYSQPFGDILESIGAPEWLQGFGFQGNITFNDSTATTPDGVEIQLPDTSDLLANASLYYEQYGLSARVSYQYRGDWLNSVALGDPIGNRFWNNVSRLDLSLRYALNPRAEMFFDATNLLDFPGIRYEGIPSRIYEYEQFGSRFMAGVRINLGAGTGGR
jgi:TonB-dependent receptor